MTLLIIPTILMLALLFTRLTHPLSLGLTLLIQTVSISLNTGLSLYSFWFSYILFMIFLGGMLVLFIYVASLASNESFSFSFFYMFTSLLILLLIFLMCLFMDPILMVDFSSLPTASIDVKLSTPLITSWIYSNSNMMFTLFIILYLLLTLVVVVKITNLFKGPLRLMN
uniref:NADH-ubiquinone oxidoreductase chain 6 n=2 Tax=Chionoecetes TaxID=41209 RepID=A0A6M4SQZ4_CHIOP|nr:NADH dehydrogenase subunit 6 [Chionoecetes opilio x Chionoecetes japonicus]QJS52753.1 NADH dehydrogenase subunit 6 [Chionoecetes opilio]UWV18219.1 NADH dehydrogenase subunit 6 [Chionoecetes opilio x Chionoecetes japonicus]WAI96442.1 NADH dehydrogenase subunit 6 [Chionoecetes opilio x Chionoecetes japonicus]